jgi:hypothetical protein
MGDLCTLQGSIMIMRGGKYSAIHASDVAAAFASTAA